MTADEQEYSLAQLLPPERQAGESVAEYKNRRRVCNAAVKVYLRGRYAHVSTELKGEYPNGRLIFASHTYSVGRNADKRRRRQQAAEWRMGNLCPA